MTQEEWLLEFQVLNGRQPTEAEIARASRQQFQTQATGARPAGRLNWFLVLKVLALLALAVFGYIVGFLFT